MKISVHDQTQGLDKFLEEDVNFNSLMDIASTKSYSLSIFRDNIRQIKNFISTEAIGLDIDNDDDVNMSLLEAQEIFDSYKHIIMTTKSHQKSEKNGKPIKKTDRFRVILFLSQPITDPKVFQATWHTLKNLYPAIDKACKDPARFWFASPQVVSYRALGKLIDPTPVKDEGVERVSKPLAPSIFLDMLGKGAISVRTKEFLKNGAPDGQWNHELFASAKDIQQQGYSREEAIQLLEQATLNYQGSLDKRDLITIDSAFRNPNKYAPRHNPNDLIKEFLRGAHHIVNLEDSSDNFFVDLETGTTKDVDARIVSQLLNKDDLSSLRDNRTLFCQFKYIPTSNTLIEMSEDNVAPIYNTYKPPFWYKNYFYNLEPPKDGKIPPIMSRFIDHFTGNHRESREYLLDWTATALQSRNFTMLTAIGEPGVGKGVFGDILEKIFGIQNYAKTRDTVFKNYFNAQIKDKQLVFVDELSLSSKEAHDRFKDVVNSNVEIEAKGKDAIMIENKASFYIASNHMDAIKLDINDRRVSAIELTDVPLREVFTEHEIASLTNKNIISEFAWYLKNRKVTRSMLSPFRSEKFEHMVELSLTNWAQWLIHKYIPSKKPSRIPLQEIRDILSQEFPNFRAPGAGKFETLASFYKKLFKITRVKGVDGAREYFLEILEQDEG